MEHIKNGTADKSGESDKIINISILIQYIQSFFERFLRFTLVHGTTKAAIFMI